MYAETMFDTINLAFTKMVLYYSYIMKIKSRFALKRGVILDLKIGDFGWIGGVLLAQNPRKGGYFSSWGVGGGGGPSTPQ